MIICAAGDSDSVEKVNGRHVRIREHVIQQRFALKAEVLHLAPISDDFQRPGNNLSHHVSLFILRGFHEGIAVHPDANFRLSPLQADVLPLFFIRRSGKNNLDAVQHFAVSRQSNHVHPRFKILKAIGNSLGS